MDSLEHSERGTAIHSDGHQLNSTQPVLVYDLLRREIVQGVRRPGSRLIEAQLASAYGVSRTPVRAALVRLEADGLVESIPNRGAVVTSWTDSDVEEIYALRLRLEPYASRIAAGRMDDQELDRIEAAAAEMLHLVDGMEENWSERCVELNADFHSSILRGSGSPRLIAIVSSLTSLPLVSRAISLLPTETRRRNFQQHLQIVDALRQGDGEWAEALMTAHILGAVQALRTKGLSQGEGLIAPEGRSAKTDRSDYSGL